MPPRQEARLRVTATAQAIRGHPATRFRLETESINAETTNDVSTEKIRAARTKAAERMGAAESGARKGSPANAIEIWNREINELVRRGLLSAEEQTDRNAILKAIYAHLDRTLRRAPTNVVW